MIKTARVEPGKTPSAISGGVSDHVEKGEALAEGEHLLVDMVEVARGLREDPESNSSDHK